MASQTERFPIFTWDLFSKVPPQIKVDYGIRITGVDGRDLYFPRYFEAADGLVASPRSIDASMLTQTIGRAERRGDQERADAELRRFEARFFAGLDSADYELVERRSDVKERARCGCFQEETVLRTFRFERAAG